MSEQISSVARGKYFDHPNHCPFCGSERIDAINSVVADDHGEASQGVECNECGASWLDVYKLNDVEVLSAPRDGMEILIPTPTVITISEGEGLVFDTIIFVTIKIGDLDEILVASLPVYAEHTSETQVEEFIETWQAIAKRNGFVCKVNVNTTEIFETALERLERLKRK